MLAFKCTHSKEDLLNVLDARTELCLNNTDVETNVEINNIVRIVKELFVLSRNNRDELSKLVDKYLIPSVNERTHLAEVSTPYELRKKMLDRLPG